MKSKSTSDIDDYIKYKSLYQNLFYAYLKFLVTSNNIMYKLLNVYLFNQKFFNI